MQFELLRVAVAVLATAYLAYEDYKTSFMNQQLLYAMVGIGLVLDIASLNESIIVSAAVGCALIFGIGYYYFRKGEIGGGDVLLLTGIHALFPFAPTVVSGWVGNAINLQLDPITALIYSNFNSAVPFVVSVLVTATVLGLIGSAVHYSRKLWGKPLKPDLLTGGLGVLAAAVIVGFGSYYFGITALQAIVYAAVLVPAVFMAAFGKQIQQELVVEPTALSDILDEDVLAIEMMDQKIVAKYGLGRVVDAGELKKLKEISRKHKVRKFPIARDLPRFGPYLFAGLIACLAFGNVLVLLYLIH
jgi:hypothetical protein